MAQSGIGSTRSLLVKGSLPKPLWCYCVMHSPSYGSTALRFALSRATRTATELLKRLGCAPRVSQSVFWRSTGFGKTTCDMRSRLMNGRRAAKNSSNAFSKRLRATSPKLVRVLCALCYGASKPLTSNVSELFLTCVSPFQHRDDA